VIRLLEGVRVVECAVLFNGDQTGRILADLGADVIKVEAPGVGDYLRDFLGQITPHNSPAHLYVNRNKRSVTLNLRSDEGRAVFFDLLRTADIFVDGFAGDACTRLGIGYEQQRQIKPEIIYAQCSGFGAGPYAEVPTHGQMMGALAGTMELEMGDDGLVTVTRPGITDATVIGASYTALTAIAALGYRDRTGEGVFIDGAGSDAALATDWFFPTYAWNDSRLTDRSTLPATGGRGRSAKYQFYETKDGKFLLFCGIEHKFWNNFCDAVDRPDLRDDDPKAPVDFASGEEALRRELQHIFHTRTLAEWIDVARDHDIAMGPALQVDDLANDPHLRHRGIAHEEVHPDAGPFTSVGWPAPVSGQAFEVFRPAPALGEDTDEVLAELGFGPDRLDALRIAGII
jgi:crotonobetainyl-CoA:carnitine CoA-transferase CaiB-like acyl-CoA transferase